MPNMEVGGTLIPSEDYLITLRCTWEDQASENSYASGNLYTTARVESEAFSIAQQVCDKLLETGDETLSIKILEPIHALRSFLDQISSAISPKLSYDLLMTLETWNEKCDWPPLLGPFNPLSLSLSISGISGGRIQKKNVYLASVLPASSTTPSSDVMVRVATGLNVFEQ
jgi:hypothetical protein